MIRVQADIEDKTLHEISEIIREGLIRDGRVSLHQFGSFRLAWTKPRHRVDAKTGLRYLPKPQPKVIFTPAKHLRDLIDPNPEPVVPLQPAASPAVAAQQPSVAAILKPASIETVNTELAARSPVRIPGTAAETMQRLNSNQIRIPDPLEPAPETIPKVTKPNVSEPVGQGPDAKPRPEMDQAAAAPAVAQSTQKSRSARKALLLFAMVPLLIVTLQHQLKITDDQAPTVTPVVAQAQAPSPSPQLAEAANLHENTDATAPRSPPVQEDVVDAVITVSASEAPPATANGTTAQANRAQPAAPQETASHGTQQAHVETQAYYMSPRVHQVRPGDNFWTLAQHYFDDPFLWPYIYRSNINKVENPDQLQVGQAIIIPGLRHSPELMSAADREQIAEGYFLVYQFFKRHAVENAHHFLLGAHSYHAQWLKGKKRQIDKKDWKRVANWKDTYYLGMNR